jgi:hypothetical protein
MFTWKVAFDEKNILSYSIRTAYIRFMRNFGSKQISVFGQAKLWNFLRQSCGMRVISAQTLIAPYWICARTPFGAEFAILRVLTKSFQLEESAVS